MHKSDFHQADHASYIDVMIRAWCATEARACLDFNLLYNRVDEPSLSVFRNRLMTLHLALQQRVPRAAGLFK